MQNLDRRSTQESKGITRELDIYFDLKDYRTSLLHYTGQAKRLMQAKQSTTDLG